MRKKERKLVITFHTTTDAMAMEQTGKEQKLQGRLIPVPKTISAGCGLAWCAAPADRGMLERVMRDAGICAQEICECLV